MSAIKLATPAPGAAHGVVTHSSAPERPPSFIFFLLRLDPAMAATKEPASSSLDVYTRNIADTWTNKKTFDL